MSGRRPRRTLSPALVGAVLALLVAVGCLSAAGRQWAYGELIDDAPVRVEGRITAATTHRNKTTDYTVTYTVRGRTYRSTTLSLDRLATTPSVGAPVPLEVASANPAVARVRGANLPDDDLPPLLVLGALTALILLIGLARKAAVNARTARRSRRKGGG
ncbi:hypothetical protein GCM10010329_02940 [Streptomyces spiroverticillatus]|uniref:DUF3592 domain-containing protein n=1 Tax=Streptomyces finlayi TaxID=67296 RepID=A0A919C7D4_9ACTN|nr:DUF3592 domain-containing protein [Streptomyces finlayi]GGZ86509.1 hypothetical protein GCM10010329_02940 [Streptomyces spiroverticillatus]GHC78032.1 hypothetical protein GCM10010334_02920 [Streptomyces finlayi]